MFVSVVCAYLNMICISIFIGLSDYTITANLLTDRYKNMTSNLNITNIYSTGWYISMLVMWTRHQHIRLTVTNIVLWKRYDYEITYIFNITKCTKFWNQVSRYRWFKTNTCNVDVIITFLTGFIIGMKQP